MSPLSLAILIAGMPLGSLQQADETEIELTPQFDQIEIRIAPEVQGRLENAPEGARLVVFLDEAIEGVDPPMDGPSLLRPQPVLSWALDGEHLARLDGGTGLLATTPELAWPVEAQALDGPFRAQAVIHLPGNPAGPGSPGDLIGPVAEIVLDATAEDRIELRIDRLQSLEPAPTHPAVVAVDRPSKLLPAIDGRPTRHRAWVVLPEGYDDIQNPRRFWPVTYVIPDSEPAAEVALRIATLGEQPEIKRILPRCIWVVVDPIGAWGHHYHVDSETNGRRGTALVEELLPWLDVRFRTIAEPEARLLMGRGAGGRSALELLTRHPDHFGRCWSISPDAVGFDHIGLLDIYRDRNAYTEENGRERPAARTPLGSERDLIHARVRDEVMLAHVLDPAGRTGRAWDARRAAFGDNGARPSLPPLPFDHESGRIDLLISSDWSVNDLLSRVRRSPDLQDLLVERAVILVGERDEFFREQGVAALAEALGVDPTLPESPIHFMPEATAETVSAMGGVGAYDGISAYLEERGLQD